MNTTELELDAKALLLKIELKKQKLVHLADSVLKDTKYTAHFQSLLNHLNINYAGVINSFIEYNADVHSRKDNEIYNSLENRVVLHLHNLIEGSWHIERQQVVYNFLQQTNVNTIADIGFGVPSLYIQKLLLSKSNIKIALCDLYPAAFDFAKLLLSLWDRNWNRTISFINTNMDDLDFIGSYDLYLFQDSIEHTINPTEYLKKYVQLAPLNSLFLFSLPIGPIIPGHYIAWKTNAEAKAWLNDCGLDVIDFKSVYVNPAVDLFAENLGTDFNNYMVLSRKL